MRVVDVGLDIRSAAQAQDSQANADLLQKFAAKRLLVRETQSHESTKTITIPHPRRALSENAAGGPSICF